MSRLAASFVLGYHGCDRAVAEKAVNGETSLLQSDKDYDWLGPGAYFWEADPKRALEWAEWKKDRGELDEPAVVGAVIDLRNCLDLVARENLELVRAAHKLFIKMQRESGLPVPENRNVGSTEDRPLRFLDCAVMRFLHRIIEESDDEPYDTVRGLFPEGEPLYDNSGFRDRNHVQIAVRRPECILGVFYPPGVT